MDDEAVHDLWDRLSDFEASRSRDAVAWLMKALADMGRFENATWAGAIRMSGTGQGDPLLGWRVAASEALRPLDLRSEDGHLAGVMEVWERREIDPSFLLPLEKVGRFRTYSLRCGLPETWFASPFYARHYGAFGIHDVVFVAFPLNADCESHFGFYSSRPVTDATLERLAYALRGVKWFHRHLMLSHGLMLASSPMTPTEHRVLQLLLTDMSERRVAGDLRLGEAATHRHVTAIYRKFGVRSRAGLISLWLNRSA